MKITRSVKMLTILSENNYKRLEYAAYYHQNKVNNGGKSLPIPLGRKLHL